MSTTVCRAFVGDRVLISVCLSICLREMGSTLGSTLGQRYLPAGWLTWQVGLYNRIMGEADSCQQPCDVVKDRVYKCRAWGVVIEEDNMFNEDFLIGYFHLLEISKAVHTREHYRETAQILFSLLSSLDIIAVFLIIHFELFYCRKLKWKKLIQNEMQR